MPVLSIICAFMFLAAFIATRFYLTRTVRFVGDSSTSYNGLARNLVTAYTAGSVVFGVFLGIFVYYGYESAQMVAVIVELIISFIIYLMFEVM